MLTYRAVVDPPRSSRRPGRFLAGVLSILLAGSPGLVGAGGGARPGPRGETAVVVDAVGRVLGPVMDPGFLISSVAVRTADGVAVVAVAANRFGNTMTPVIAFESSDCTGPAWLWTLTDQFLGIASVGSRSAIGPGSVLYGASGPPEARSIQSLWDLNHDPQAGCFPFGPESLQVYPVVALADLSIFTPPFRILLQPREVSPADGRPGVLPLEVINGNGQPLGSYLAAVGDPTAITAGRTVGGRSVVFELRRDRPHSIRTVHYSQPGCTGAAFVTPVSFSTDFVPILDSTGIGAGQALLVASGSATPGQAVASRFESGAPVPHCVDSPAALTLHPAVEALGPDSLVGPFSVR